ncbi:MAG: CHRD domain-containing protein [Saprospiraceae bacterium]
MVTIDWDQTNAHFMMVVSGLETDFTAAHFHNARPA